MKKMLAESEESEKLNKRVVVTGLGVVSSLGIGWKEFWNNLTAGKSGINRISSFDISGYDKQYAGEVKNFDPLQYMSYKAIQQMGRASQYALAASKLALQDAHVNIEKLDTTRIGVCIGTTMGEPQVLEKLDEKCFSDKKYSIDFHSALTYPASTIATNVAHNLKLKNYTTLISNACAAGNYSIARAYDLIKSNKVDFMLAGGSDALSRVAFTGFFRLYAMATQKCQPFDKDRKGMIPGEGSGMIILETFESALKRKAAIYAEILGYGLSCDAHHMAQPDYIGVSTAIKKSLASSRININQVDYICAHGTGTKENDIEECKALKKIFGSYLLKIPVSSIKSMLGHTMGAAAALGSVACCLTVKNDEISPTINLENLDPGCEIDPVANKARRKIVNIAINNAQAFGGNNACLVFKKYSAFLKLKNHHKCNSL